MAVLLAFNVPINEVHVLEAIEKGKFSKKEELDFKMISQCLIDALNYLFLLMLTED